MKTLLTIALFLTCALVKAQVNFVKNPSLEVYSECPSNSDQIKYANFWSPIDTIGLFPNTPLCSPEYCNICDVSNYVGVPIGNAYHHFPHTGNGMAQVQMYSDEYHAPDYKRDYLQGRFHNHLTLGKSYCVTFFVTLEQASAYAIQNIAAYIDNGNIDNIDSAGCALPQTAFTPQIIDTNVINDTVNWHKIQGSFVSNGTERFITIGNFADKAHTRAVAIMDTTGLPALGWGGFTWYLVDDVSVIESDAVANAGTDKIIPLGSTDSVVIGDTLDTYLPVYWYRNGIKIDSNKASIKVHPDTTTKYVVSLDICGHVTYDTVTVQVVDTSVHNHEGFVTVQLNSIRLYPNPASNQVALVNANGLNFTLTNTIGQIVYQTNITTQNQSVDISGIPSAIYYGVFTDRATGQKRTMRLIKQ